MNRTSKNFGDRGVCRDAETDGRISDGDMRGHSVSWWLLSKAGSMTRGWQYVATVWQADLAQVWPTRQGDGNRARGKDRKTAA